MGGAVPPVKGPSRPWCTRRPLACGRVPEVSVLTWLLWLCASHLPPLPLTETSPDHPGVSWEILNLIAPAETLSPKRPQSQVLGFNAWPYLLEATRSLGGPTVPLQGFPPHTCLQAPSTQGPPASTLAGSPGRWVLPAAWPQCGVQFVQKDGGVGRGAFRSWNRPQSVLSSSVPRDAPSPSCSPCGSVTKCHRAGLLPPP